MSAQPARIHQSLQIPGDKSLTHRAAIFASLAKGQSVLHGYLPADDTLRTMAAFGQFGIQSRQEGTTFIIESPGLWQMAQDGTIPTDPKLLDVGNSGTAMRLLAGLFAGTPGANVRIVGDESLSKRPMTRISDPIASCGGHITTSPAGTAPLTVDGRRLKPIRFTSQKASAQIKSAIMLGGLMSNVSVDFSEPILSRNHTENMLRSSCQLETGQNDGGAWLRMTPPYHLNPIQWHIPGDISSAAFFIAAGLLAAPGSQLTLKSVGLNPTRTGILDVLPSGAFSYANQTESLGEAQADLVVQPVSIESIAISQEIVPRLIDEIPILSIIGLAAKDGFVVRGAEELRVKESDRIALMVENLRRLGVTVQEFEDGYQFKANMNQLQPGAVIETAHDHRIVMSFAVLDALYKLRLDIRGKGWVETSFPNFFELLQQLENQP